MNIITTILPAVITGVVTLTVCLINNYYSQRKMRSDSEKLITDIIAKQQQSIAIIELKIDNLEKKQDRHNGAMEKIYDLEKLASNMQIIFNNIEKRLEHVEDKE